MTYESVEYGKWHWADSYWTQDSFMGGAAEDGHGWQSGWRREIWQWHSGFLYASHVLTNLECKPWSWCWGWPVEHGEWAWDWDHGLQRARAHACIPQVQAVLEMFRENDAEPSHMFRNGSQMRLLDIAVLHGDSVSVRALVKFETATTHSDNITTN